MGLCKSVQNTFAEVGLLGLRVCLHLTIVMVDTGASKYKST